MKEYIVRAADYDAGFVEKEIVKGLENAMKRAEELGKIFGSWNVEIIEH